eukprot:s1234_g7.t1
MWEGAASYARPAASAASAASASSQHRPAPSRQNNGQKAAEARLANLHEERKRKKFWDDFRRREERFQKCQSSGRAYKATARDFFTRSFTKGFRRSNYDTNEFLKQYKVKDLPLPTALVTLPSKKGLFHAIQVLTDQHLLSAPVVDDDGPPPMDPETGEVKQEGSEGKLLGILDTLDVASLVVDMEAAGKKSLTDERLDKLMGRSTRAKVASCSEEDTLDQVVESLIGPGRRAVVLKDGNLALQDSLPWELWTFMESGMRRKPLSIITQSTAIMFLHSKAKEFEALMSSYVAKERKGDVCTDGVITIDDQATALTAFQTLVAQGVSSLTITDESGNAITVVSATDLVVALGHERDKSAILSELRDRNVVFFVGDSRKPDKRFSHTRAPIISCGSDLPLGQVIEKFATTRVHRMLVIPQGTRKPEGVVSLIDICRILTKPLPEEPFSGSQMRNTNMRHAVLGSTDGFKRGLSHSHGQPVPEQTLRRAFREIDMDQDGLISVRELTRALRRCGVDASKKTVERILQDCGYDAAGQLSADQFVRFFRATENLVWSVDDEYNPVDSCCTYCGRFLLFLLLITILVMAIILLRIESGTEIFVGLLIGFLATIGVFIAVMFVRPSRDLGTSSGPDSPASMRRRYRNQILFRPSMMCCCALCYNCYLFFDSFLPESVHRLQVLRVDHQAADCCGDARLQLGTRDPPIQGVVLIAVPIVMKDLPEPQAVSFMMIVGLYILWALVQNKLVRIYAASAPVDVIRTWATLPYADVSAVTDVGDAAEGVAFGRWQVRRETRRHAPDAW